MLARPLPTCFAVPLIAAFTTLCSLAADLPQAPQYLGDIRRDAQGQIITITKPAAAALPGTSAIPPAVPDASPAVPELLKPAAANQPTAKPAQGNPPQPKRAATGTAPTGAPHVATLLRVGPTHTLRTIAAAAAIAQDGDTVEIDAGNYVADVATWRQDRLTLRGVGGPVRLLAAGASAQGKAIWVISGGQVTVENINFSGAKVSDKNGAGIRFERGQLTVKHCVFLNNENGILTAADPKAELTIENSEYGYNGAGDGYSHNLYVGHIKKLTVKGSYFHHANVGHLLKSRAAENQIFYNRLTDELGGTASYELEFPNGGLAYVVGNIVQQASTTTNANTIAYGMEGYTWPKNELYLAYNTIVDDSVKGGFFLQHKPGLDKLVAANNVLVGKGSLDGGLKRIGADLAKRLIGKTEEAPPDKDTGELLTNHNLTTGWESFVQASRYNYQPKGGDIAQFKTLPLTPVNGIRLEPERQYLHTAQISRLAPGPLMPGAVQLK